MKTMNSHSEPVLAFKKYCQGWDDEINNQDSKETQAGVKNRLFNSMAIIERFLVESDENAKKRAKKDNVTDLDKVNEIEILAMIENQKKSWYKKFQRISLDVNYVMCIIDSVYELKNRRSHECFKLRAENSKLKAELENLKNEKSS